MLGVWSWKLELLPADSQRHQRFDALRGIAGGDGDEELSGGQAGERQIEPEPGALLLRSESAARRAWCRAGRRAARSLPHRSRPCHRQRHAAAAGPTGVKSRPAKATGSGADDMVRYSAALRARERIGVVSASVVFWTSGTVTVRCSRSIMSPLLSWIVRSSWMVPGGDMKEMPPSFTGPSNRRSVPFLAVTTTPPAAARPSMPGLGDHTRFTRELLSVAGRETNPELGRTTGVVGRQLLEGLGHRRGKRRGERDGACAIDVGAARRPVAVARLAPRTPDCFTRTLISRNLPSSCVSFGE